MNRAEIERHIHLNDAAHVRGFTGVVLDTCFNRDFFKHCQGHESNDPQQSAHDCLETAYISNTVCKISAMMDPDRLFKMLSIIYGLMKKPVRLDMLNVIKQTLREIQHAVNPRRKMFNIQFKCPPPVKKLTMRVLHMRCFDVYYKNKSHRCGLTPRKLVY